MSTSIGIPNNTKLLHIIRHCDHWQLWVSTKDFVYGTYFQCYDNGAMFNVTLRDDALAPERFQVHPSITNAEFW